MTRRAPTIWRALVRGFRCQFTLLAVHNAVCGAVVGRCTFTPACPRVDRARSQRSKLKYDERLSKLAFNFKLRRYSVGFAVVANVPEERDRAQLRFGQIVRYCLPLAVCHSMKLYLQNKVGRGRQCSPRHSMPSDSRDEGAGCVG